MLKNPRLMTLTVIMASVWLVAAFLFSEPNREDPMSARGMDLIAKAKLLSRLGAMGLLVAVNLFARSRRSLISMASLYWPLLLYLAWAVVSVVWSPLPEVSLGQAFSLAVMIALAITISRYVETVEDAVYIVTHLLLICALRGTAMVLLQLKTGGTAVSRGEEGIFHSTDAAETAGLGMVLMFGLFMCLPRARFNALFFPVMAVHGMLFVFAQNRFSLLVNLACIGLYTVMNASRQTVLRIALAGSLLFPLYVVFDPGVEIAGELIGATQSFSNRENSDSSEAVTTFSGRTELWAAVWEQYIQTPIQGIGYFVTSQTGELDVWGKVVNYTAHNQIFQVLATTGLVGLAIFMAVLWKPFVKLRGTVFRNGEEGDFSRFVLGVLCWLILWGLLNVSFSGPISCSPICFFTCLGCIMAEPRSSKHE